MPFSARTLAYDVIAIFVFAVLARLAHNTESEPFGVFAVLDTWWPFLIGVFVGHILVSLTAKHPAHLAPGGLLVWALTAFTGLAIWSARNAAVPHWSFILVATLMSAVLLLGWRAIAPVVAKRLAED